MTTRTTSPVITHARQQVIGCTRLSSAVQELGYGESAQVADLTLYTKKHGLTMVGVIHEVQSGADSLHSRDAVQEYFRLAQQHPGLGFVFPRVDRLGRLAERIITIARDLMGHGARVYVVGFDKALDANAPEWLMFQFKALMAEQDYLGIIDRLGKGKRGKAAKGLWSHGAALWGYRLLRDERGNAILPEPDENAPAVLRCWELRETLGRMRTAQAMREEGWPPPSEAGWNVSVVDNITTNLGYTGRSMQSGHLVTFPAIVPPDLAARVQAAVKRRVRERRNPSEHLLSGFARCPECHAAMVWMGVRGEARKSDGHRRQYGYYRCWQQSYGRGDADKRCSHAAYHKDSQVEAEAWALFSRVVTNAEELAHLYVPPVMARPEHGERIEVLKDQMGEAFSRAITVGIPDDILERSLRPLRAELARLEAEMKTPLPPPEVNLERIAETWREALPYVTEQERREVLGRMQAQFLLRPEGVSLVRLVVATE